MVSDLWVMSQDQAAEVLSYPRQPLDDVRISWPCVGGGLGGRPTATTPPQAARSVTRRMMDAVVHAPTRWRMQRNRDVLHDETGQEGLPWPPLSADRRGLRTPQCPHPLAQLACEGGCPLLRHGPLCPPPGAAWPLHSGKDLLGVGLSVIARRPFPGTPPRTRDRHQMLIALGWSRRHLAAHHRLLPGRGKPRAAGGRPITAVSTGSWSSMPSPMQRAMTRSTWEHSAGPCEGSCAARSGAADATLCPWVSPQWAVSSSVWAVSPRAAGPAMRLGRRPARHCGHRAGISVPPQRHDCPAVGSPRWDGVVTALCDRGTAGPSPSGQAGMEEPFGVSQRQAQEQAKREGRLDGTGRRHGLCAALAGLRRCPGVNGLWPALQGQVTTIAERLVILAPVFHAIRRLVVAMPMGAYVGAVMCCTVGGRMVMSTP